MPQVFRNAVYGEYISSTLGVPTAVYPVAAPGVYLEAAPWPWLEMRVGVYAGDPGNDERDNYGFDWRVSGNAGATIAGEVATHPRLFGVPGTLAFGVLGHTGDTQNFDRGGESDGTHVLYGMLEQTLIEIGDLDEEPETSLGLFFRFAIPMQDDRVVVDWQINGGLELRGPIPGRAEDSAGIGFAYLDFAKDYLEQTRSGGNRVAGSELSLELTYRAPLTPWLSIQPDFQYFVDPHFGRSDALAFGFSLTIDL